MLNRQTHFNPKKNRKDFDTICLYAEQGDQESLLGLAFQGTDLNLQILKINDSHFYGVYSPLRFLAEQGKHHAVECLLKAIGKYRFQQLASNNEPIINLNDEKDIDEAIHDYAKNKNLSTLARTLLSQSESYKMQLSKLDNDEEETVMVITSEEIDYAIEKNDKDLLIFTIKMLIKYIYALQSKILECWIDESSFNEVILGYANNGDKDKVTEILLRKEQLYYKKLSEEQLTYSARNKITPYIYQKCQEIINQISKANRNLEIIHFLRKNDPAYDCSQLIFDAICEAAAEGNIKTLEEIDKDFSLDFYYQYTTPIRFLAQRKNVSAVNCLLKFHANSIKLHASVEEAILGYQLSGELEQATALKNLYPSVNEVYSLLGLKLSKVPFNFRQNINLNVTIHKPQANLHYCIIQELAFLNNKEVLLFYLKETNTPLDTLETILIELAEHGYHQAVHTLIACGANPRGAIIAYAMTNNLNEMKRFLAIKNDRHAALLGFAINGNNKAIKKFSNDACATAADFLCELIKNERDEDLLFFISQQKLLLLGISTLCAILIDLARDQKYDEIDYLISLGMYGREAALAYAVVGAEDQLNKLAEENEDIDLRDIQKELNDNLAIIIIDCAKRKDNKELSYHMNKKESNIDICFYAQGLKITPLSQMILENNTEAAQFLIEHGANVYQSILLFFVSKQNSINNTYRNNAKITFSLDSVFTSNSPFYERQLYLIKQLLNYCSASKHMLAFFEYFQLRDSSYLQKIYSKKYRARHLNHEESLERLFELVSQCALAGDIQALMFLRHNITDWHIQLNDETPVSALACGGHVEAVDLLINQFNIPCGEAAKGYARGGHVELLQTLLKKNNHVDLIEIIDNFKEFVEHNVENTSVLFSKCKFFCTNIILEELSDNTNKQSLFKNIKQILKETLSNCQNLDELMSCIEENLTKIMEENRMIGNAFRKFLDILPREPLQQDNKHTTSLSSRLF